MSDFDGIVVGGGHNGLTCAVYLAKAGLSVAVVERNPVPGGGCSTAELTLPGFRHNSHSNYHFLEEGPVPADLELHRHGLRYIYPDVQHATIFRDGRAITVHRDPELGQYRTPITGLYLCGASSHPGGSVSAAPGYNAAGAIDDLGIKPWWTPVPPPAWAEGS